MGIFKAGTRATIIKVKLSLRTLLRDTHRLKAKDTLKISRMTRIRPSSRHNRLSSSRVNRSSNRVYRPLSGSREEAALSRHELAKCSS